VVTEATLSVSRTPGPLRWVAVAPPSFEAGMDLVREVVQRDLRPLLVRLYDPADAAVTFEGLGHPGGCVLLLGFAEPMASDAERAGRLASDGDAGALDAGYGEHWWEHRYDAVDRYRGIMGERRVMGAGVVVDTLEVAGLWSRLSELYAAVGAALSRHAEAVGCHLSHPYRSGGSLYFTFLLRRPDDEAAGEVYLRCWRDAAEACHRAGGTVSHHHGVGLLKAPFMLEELGEGGLAALRRIKAALDPDGLLNPGKLIPGPR
jgi:alkyldihydroxyacetonephosphate synthase